MIILCNVVVDGDDDDDAFLWPYFAQHNATPAAARCSPVRIIRAALAPARVVLLYWRDTITMFSQLLLCLLFGLVYVFIEKEDHHDRVCVSLPTSFPANRLSLSGRQQQ